MKKIALATIFLLFLTTAVKADTYLTGCAQLNTAGETYYLTQDIINSTASVCMLISVDNVILDCQGHTIDGIDASSTYGIYVYRASATTTNITVKNCIVTDWYYGIYFYNSHSNTLTNITASSNAYYGLYLSYSNSNTINNSKIQNSVGYGIYLASAGANLIYNNLFNNTNNFVFAGTIYSNYWNTTRQPGTRIYSPGNEIGGNYWTNPDGNGYSDTCNDTDKDGFCDDPYVLATGNIDYLALSDKYCACTNWAAGGCYNTTHRIYTRTCTPSGCDVEIKYEEDSTCAPPPTLPPSYPWLNLLSIILTPFWIVLLLAFSMSAKVESKLMAGGIAFLSSLIIFLFIFSFFTKTIPLWMPILLLIIAFGYIIFRGRA